MESLLPAADAQAAPKAITLPGLTAGLFIYVAIIGWEATAQRG
jgi:hypothetical protein